MAPPDFRRLFGTVLTGIGPAAAKTIVGLGIDVSAMHTCNLLADGIELALTLIHRSGAPGATPHARTADPRGAPGS